MEREQSLGLRPRLRRRADFEELLRRSQDSLRQLFRSGSSGRGAAILALFTLLTWLVSGFYTVGPTEVGLNVIFGKYRGKTQAGLNYNLPAPLGSIIKLAVTDVGIREEAVRRALEPRGSRRLPKKA